PTRELATGEAGQSIPRVPAWGLGLFILAVTASTLWPFWWGLVPSRDRAFMLRDMMVPFNLSTNDLVLGKGDYSPRALPQDAILGVFSPFIPATTLAAAFVLIAAACGILGAVKMARDMAGGPRAAPRGWGPGVGWGRSRPGARAPGRGGEGVGGRSAPRPAAYAGRGGGGAR